MLAGCSDAPSPELDLPPAAECTVAVLASDFSSTALSLVTDAGERCRDELMTSGSAAPGLVNALSGDVVLPSTATGFDSELVLIDRFPNAVLTFVSINDDAEASVRGQLSVATGFASNPHDYLALSPTQAYVTRHATNQASTSGLDRGGDLLIIDPSALTITGRVDLGESVDGIDPRPSRMALANGWVWVGLARLSRDFDRVGSGRVVAVDPETDAVVATVELDTMVNCGGALVAAEPDSDGRVPGIWVSCAGHFTNGVIDPAGAGVAYIDVLAVPPHVTLTVDATALGQTPGWGLAATTTGVLVATFGERDRSDDQLVHIDRSTGTAERLPVMTPAFQFGSLVRTPEQWLVLDADPVEPSVWVSGGVDAIGLSAGWRNTPFVTGSGLPPRHALRRR